MSGTGQSRFAKVLVPLTLAGCACTAAAQTAEQNGAIKTVHIVRAAEPPVIDGKLDDEVWATAAVIQDLHQVTPTEYAEPSERTIFYLLVDEDALYVAARMFDREPDRMSAKMLKQGDSLRWEDHLMLNLHPFRDQRSGYRIEVNPNGVRWDGIYQNTNRILWDWDGIWTAGTSRDAEGWTAEVAIPFKTLSFDPNVDTWGFNISRNIGRKNERVCWMSRNRSQDPSTAGLATGLTDLESGVGLDIVASASVRHSNTYGPAASDVRLEPSLDAFYKITPQLNTSVTFNTDFSATEVDDRQVNLTRFATFFPEKRDFFLKDADSFDFGRIGVLQMAATLPAASFENGRAFFSRRIGLSGTGQPVDLDYGGKLSGRLGPLNLGALAIRQAAYGEIEAKDLLVARATVNPFARSALGMIVTHGDPRSDLDNSVIGADFNYLNSQLPGGRVLETEAWYQRSETDGNADDAAAWGLRVHMPNGTGLRGGISVKELEANFNPALGFVNRRGARDVILELGHTRRQRTGLFRSFFTGVDAERVELLDGGLLTQIVTLRALELESRRGDVISFRYSANKEVLHLPFEISPGIAIPAGDYTFGEYRFSVDMPDFLTFSPLFTLARGDFFDGDKLNVRVGLDWRPSVHFRSRLIYDVTDVELPQGDFTTRLLQAGVDIVFSNTLAWVNLIQYDNVSSVLGLSSRLHWMPQAGRDMFLAVDHNMSEAGTDNQFHSIASESALKFSYTYRF